MPPEAQLVPKERLDLTALVAVLLGVTLITLDISLTSTSLPAIAKGLGVTPASTIWIVNIYFLAVVATLLPAAAAGEIFGHRRLYVLGLATFGLGILASGLAATLPTLTAGRALAGIGSAAISATTPALIRAIYPPDRLNRGLGLYAMVVGVAFTAGPTAASTVLSILSWPWLFLLNVPLVFAAIAMAFMSLPETTRSRRPFDVRSALLCAASLASLLFAIAGAAHLGAKPALAALVLAVTFGIALMRREAGKAAPILAADLFRNPIFALSSFTSICAFTLQGLVFVLLPFFLHFELGFPEIATGFLIIPWPVALILTTSLASRATNKVHPGLMGGIGLAVLAGSLASIALLSSPTDSEAIVWRLILCGIGFGLFQSPNMVAIMSSAPPERSGGAGGILALSRLLGQSLGAAAVAFCLSRWAGTGSFVAIWIGVVAAILGAGTSLLRLSPTFSSPRH